MGCTAISQREVEESYGYKFLQNASGTVALLSIVICMIALSILLDNHLRLNIWEPAFENVTVLKPGTIHVVFSIAKWSGIIGSTALGAWGGLYFYKLTRTHQLR